MKKLFSIVLALTVTGMLLAGCSKGGDSQENQQPAAGEIQETQTTADESGTDVADADAAGTDANVAADNETESVEADVEVPATVYVSMKTESIPDEAKEYGVITGKDEKNNAIWEYTTEEVYVGQYDSISYPQLGPDGVYFTCGRKLYCIDTVTENFGEIKWVNEDNFSDGCSICFDEDGNIYVIAYEANGFFVVDKDGKTLSHIEELKFINPDDVMECFWKSGITYVDGYLVVKFDSIEDTKAFNVKNGEEGLPERDYSDIYGDWEFVSREVEGDFMTAEELGGKVTLSIPDENTVSFYCKDESSGEVDDFKKMEASVKLGDMYYGIDNSAHGKWYITCEHDEKNSFSISLSESDTLEMFWYVGPVGDLEYPNVVHMIFKKES